MKPFPKTRFASRSRSGIRDRAILAALLYHGIRREELCLLRLRDIQSRQGVMHFRVQGKGSKIRFVPVHALAHNTGGSSSGSGAAVGASLAYGALGTDTGGSVRNPASYCGIVGMIATYGLVPIRGIIPLTVSLDHCGPLTRTVADTAQMLNILAGYDKLDITSIEHSREDYVAALQQPVNGFRLGMPAGHFDDLDPEVARATQDAIALLAKLTQGTKDVSLPSITSLPNLNSLGETLAYHEQYVKSSAAKYMLPQRRRMEAALANPPKAADYIRAKWDLDLLRRTVDGSFTDFDLVVVPTMRILPPLLDDLIKRNHDPKLTDPLVTNNTPPFDVYGLPAISLRCRLRPQASMSR